MFVCYNAACMKRIGFILLLTAALAALPAAPEAPKDIIARLEQNLSALSSFQANFEQTSFASSVATPLKENGRLYFKKPDLMRWEYIDPEPKTYIYKDEVFLSYFPEDNQLWRQRLPKEKYETEILALLAGQARLAEKYVIESSPFPGGEKNAAQLKLMPREEEGENAYILLEIDRKTWMILRAIFFDWAGNKTEFTFSRIKVNPRFSKDLFDLKVPPDCEIIEDEGPRKK